MQMYTVGGCVRDQIMGVSSNDVDFTVVLEPSDMDDPILTHAPRDPFTIMADELEDRGFKIFLKTPEHLTIRAQFPDRNLPMKKGVIGHQTVKRTQKGLTADFVLARKEGTYSDGRRPDSVEVGTLEDDLARRDFTMNAIAVGGPGYDFIDPFDGRQDIADRVIRAVGSAHDRLMEDALRAVRALRFSVTTGFRIDKELEFAMNTAAVLNKVFTNISDERITGEINKMFKHDTMLSLSAFQRYPALTAAMFAGKVNLEATMKQKGFK